MSILVQKKAKRFNILDDLVKIQELAGLNFHGFQLNLVWPEINVLKEYRMRFGFSYYIVLQIGKKALEVVGGSPQGIVDKLSLYASFINGILFDLSGGLGKPLDIERTKDFLFAIKNSGFNLGIGVAGGLGPQSLHLVRPLLYLFHFESI